MTSRERVLMSLNHKEPPQVAVDFGGHRSSGIAAMAYQGLRRQLGLEAKPTYVYDIIQQLAIIHDDVLDRLRVDVTELGRAFNQDDADWVDWVLPDGSPCKVPAWSVPERTPDGWILRSGSGRPLAIMPDGALYFEQTYFPFIDQPDSDLQTALSECVWTAVQAPPGPSVSTDDLREGAKAFRAATDRAIVGLFGGNLLETGQFLYRNDNFFMLLAGEPKKAHRFLDELVELHLQNLETYLDAVGDSIDVILFGDDLGMQTGPQISPQMYRDFFKPRHKTMWMRAKELADVKVMLHCCGGVRELLPDLIEAGLDCINPVQVTCSGMDARQLKADFGRDMVFWGGGCDTRQVLPHGTPDEIRQHVHEQVEITQPGGGFVFQQVHNIMANVPPENITAMFEGVWNV